MKESYFQAEFQDVFIELQKSALKSFIHKLLQAQFKISWRHQEDSLELVINAQGGKVVLPIYHQRNDLTVIELSELSICLEELAILLEDLITEAKGRAIVKTQSRGWIYVSCFEQGKIVSVMKIGGGEKVNKGSYRTMKKKSPVDKVDPVVLNYVIMKEIDYYLMELADALNCNSDPGEVQEIKKTLSKLVEEKNRINLPM